jgi:hypothetical protein
MYRFRDFDDKKPSDLGIEILEKSCTDLGILMTKKLHI